jgi:electron transfer flavoprotein beta subunit
MKAKKKPFRELTLSDLGLNETDITPKTQRLGLTLPPARQAGKLLAGSPAEQAAELVRLLRSEAKVI